jgi:TetR/AcrR family transcriptional regulator
MPPRSDDDSEKRARILDAAYRVCEQRGVEGARMEEVASLAGVSKGTLYRFFESKEELFLATVIDSYQHFLPLFDAGASPQAGPRQRLEALLDGLLRILEAVAPRMNLHYQAWGLVAKDPALRDRLQGFLRGFHAERGETLAGTIREGQRQGVFRPDADARAVADGIQALLSGFLYRGTFDPARAGPPRLRRCFDVLVRDALLIGEEPEGEGVDG